MIVYLSNDEYIWVFLLSEN